jgi:hypothetical protein
MSARCEVIVNTLSTCLGEAAISLYTDCAYV